MNLRKFDRFTPFAAGLAIGVTATLLFVPKPAAILATIYGTPPAESAMD